MNRYDTSGLIEAQFEPGSHRRALKNLLGIKRKREMDSVEAQEHYRAMDKLTQIYNKDHRFNADDICRIHKICFGKIYEWAGRYRMSNLSKGGFLFADARQIPNLMDKLEKDILSQFTPCVFESESEVIQAIAVVHTELILIHPFRDGNGRNSRILATLMAFQAGLPALDFGGIKGKKRQEYFSSVRAGLDYNYKPMKKVFASVIRRTLRSREE